MARQCETEEIFYSLPQRVRDTSPLIHCLTNLVVNNFTANVLLAIGASPAMVTAVEETAEFAALSDAILINIGTLDSFQLAAMTAAISGAVAAGKPWVLDPITAGLPFRMAAIRPMLEQGPTVIRGNASEIISLAALSTHDFKGIDSKSSPEEALEPARYLARTYKTVVAISGETDYVTDGDKIFTVKGGHPYMTRVTGVGCALNAVIAAYIATCKDAVTGTRAALSVFSICGQSAALEAKGTGSFAVAFLDQLSSINRINDVPRSC